MGRDCQKERKGVKKEEKGQPERGRGVVFRKRKRRGVQKEEKGVQEKHVSGLRSNHIQTATWHVYYGVAYFPIQTGESGQTEGRESESSSWAP